MPPRVVPPGAQGIHSKRISCAPPAAWPSPVSPHLVCVDPAWPPVRLAPRAQELRLLGRPHRFPAALFSQLRQRLVVVAGLQVNMAAALTAAAELEVVQLAAQPGTQPESHRSSPGSSTGGSIASMVGAACVGAAADGFGSGECMSAVSERYRNWNEELEGVQVRRLPSQPASSAVAVAVAFAAGCCLQQG